jgi:hypothetical protein
MAVGTSDQPSSTFGTGNRAQMARRGTCHTALLLAWHVGVARVHTAIGVARVYTAIGTARHHH